MKLNANKYLHVHHIFDGFWQNSLPYLNRGGRLYPQGRTKKLEAQAVLLNGLFITAYPPDFHILLRPYWEFFEIKLYFSPFRSAPC